MRYLFVLALLSGPVFANDRHHPPIKVDPIQPEPVADSYKPERRWCRRDGLRGLACIAAGLGVVYWSFSYDAPKDEKVKFGLDIQRGEK